MDALEFSPSSHLHHTFITQKHDDRKNQFGNWYFWVALLCFLIAAVFWVTRQSKVWTGVGANMCELGDLCVWAEESSLQEGIGYMISTYLGTSGLHSG